MRVRVGLFGARVGAVALSIRKDDRVVKLSAFYVTEDARAAGLGQHLLWSELRTWAISGVEKLDVTVSSRHADLIGFFREFGFVLRGSRRVDIRTTKEELVLGKHLVHRLVDEQGLGSFIDEVASRVFSAPASVKAGGETWALPPASTHPSSEWSGEGASLELVALADGVAERHWGLLELERTFHPVRFSLRTRKALLVPIQPRWASAMLEYPGQQPSLFDPPSEKLILRADNAYYCYPRLLDVALPGTPILFYVSGGTGLVGEARIIDAVVGEPEEVFARFGGLGIYEISQIRGHIGKNGKHRGEALALRFGSTFRSLRLSVWIRMRTASEAQSPSANPHLHLKRGVRASTANRWPRMVTDVLMSIRPIYAEAIFDGIKTVELRRRRPSFVDGTRELVYLSSPQSEAPGHV